MTVNSLEILTHTSVFFFFFLCFLPFSAEVTVFLLEKAHACTIEYFLPLQISIIIVYKLTKECLIRKVYS